MKTTYLDGSKWIKQILQKELIDLGSAWRCRNLIDFKVLIWSKSNLKIAYLT